MKKVITGTLITAMISNNVAYCDIRQGELSDKNETVEITQSIDNETEANHESGLEEINKDSEVIQPNEEIAEVNPETESIGKEEHISDANEDTQLTKLM